MFPCAHEYRPQSLGNSNQTTEYFYGNTSKLFQSVTLGHHSFIFSFLVVCIALILQKEDDELVNTA